MRSLMAFVVAVVSAAQTVPPSQTSDKDPIVQVRGCLHGRTLFLIEDPGFAVPGRRLDLQGSRSVMRGLKEHDGHLEELVGVLKTRSQHHAVAIKEKRGEKTRVYVGASETRGDLTDDVAATPT